MRRNIVALILVIVGLSAASPGVSAVVRLRWMGIAAQIAVPHVGWVPYQMTLQRHSGTPGGPSLLAVEVTRAVRSDGSMAEYSVYHHLNGQETQRTRRLNLIGGIRILTDEGLHMMTATRTPAEDIARARATPDPSQSCAVTFGGARLPKQPDITSDSCFGYPAYKIVLDLGKYRRILWRVPTLACAEIRTYGEQIDTNSGKLVATSELMVTNIRLGEPDAALFAMPRAFRNVPPSEFASTHYGRSLPDEQAATLKTTDDHFRQYRYDP